MYRRRSSDNNDSHSIPLCRVGGYSYTNVATTTLQRGTNAEFKIIAVCRRSNPKGGQSLTYPILDYAHRTCHLNRLTCIMTRLSKSYLVLVFNGNVPLRGPACMFIGARRVERATTIIYTRDRSHVGQTIVLVFCAHLTMIIMVRRRTASGRSLVDLENLQINNDCTAMCVSTTRDTCFDCIIFVYNTFRIVITRIIYCVLILK